MSYDILDELANNESLTYCFDCYCIVIVCHFDDHKKNCVAYQKRWQEEYDMQLGASDASELKVDSPPNPKTEAARKELGLSND